MKTIITPPTDEAIERAGEIIKEGGLVAMPTETVYGLAANALDGKAVKSIYAAKGRPSDNPLIVHISKKEQWSALVEQIPEEAEALANAFWPGPLTVILKKSELIPPETSGGLETVAVRMPSNSIARRVIDAAGVPLAAPSANLSGRPSPTRAQHVIDDLDGKINMIIDGGECEVGVESTVVTLAVDEPTLLRPGGVTVEMLESVLGTVKIADAVIHELPKGETAASPGMKYKHYAPKAEVTLVKGDIERFISILKEHKGEKPAALCYDDDLPLLSGFTALSFGREDDPAEQANDLFNALRELDELGAKTVYARLPSLQGLGLAVYNRLVRAAGFKIV